MCYIQSYMGLKNLKGCWKRGKKQGEKMKKKIWEWGEESVKTCSLQNIHRVITSNPSMGHLILLIKFWVKNQISIVQINL